MNRGGRRDSCGWGMNRLTKGFPLCWRYRGVANKLRVCVVRIEKEKSRGEWWRASMGLVIGRLWSEASAVSGESESNISNCKEGLYKFVGYSRCGGGGKE